MAKVYATTDNKQLVETMSKTDIQTAIAGASGGNSPVQMTVVNTTGSGSTTTSKVAITETGVYLMSCYASNSSSVKRYCTEIIFVDDLTKDIYAPVISQSSYPAIYYSASAKAITASTAYNGTGFYINSCYQLYKL